MSEILIEEILNYFFFLMWMKLGETRYEGDGERERSRERKKERKKERKREREKEEKKREFFFLCFTEFFCFFLRLFVFLIYVIFLASPTLTEFDWVGTSCVGFDWLLTSST